MALLKGIDKNTFEYDGTSYTTVSDLLPNQLIMRFRNRKVLIPRGNNEGDIFEGVNGDLEGVDENNYKVNGTSYTTISAIKQNEFVGYFSQVMTLIANGANKWKAFSVGSASGGTTSTGLNQFLNSLGTTNLKYNSDVGAMIPSNFFPCPVNKTIFELLQPFLDFTNLNESQVQFLLDNYFGNNLELFELNIWLGDQRTGINENENEKVTIDCATLKNHNFSNGVLEIIDGSLNGGTSTGHFQFEFVEFNKNNIKIEGRHYDVNSNYKNTYNAVHSIQLVLK